jgi:hypothetical protein
LLKTGASKLKTRHTKAIQFPSIYTGEVIKLGICKLPYLYSHDKNNKHDMACRAIVRAPQAPQL